jgi:hypothetical protein
MISVEIPVLHGRFLPEVLSALRDQTSQDFETIVADGTDRSTIRDLCASFGARYTKATSGLLRARMKAHALAKGTDVLLLDETRLPLRTLINGIQASHHAMTVIEEGEVGVTLWSKLAAKDKAASFNRFRSHPGAGYGANLPRHFGTTLLTRAFEQVESALPPEVTDKIIFLDHAIIFHEALKISRDVGILSGPLILHHGDTELVSIVKKYFRYGSSTRVLSETHYEPILHQTLAAREELSARDRLTLLPLLVARGLPFIAGRAFG